MPKHIWHLGLNRLLRQVQEDGSAQDMLYWLRYGYDYIRSLRKAAPDLENDWIECQKGLDSYRYKLEKLSPSKMSYSLPMEPLVDARLSDTNCFEEFINDLWDDSSGDGKSLLHSNSKPFPETQTQSHKIGYSYPYSVDNHIQTTEMRCQTALASESGSDLCFSLEYSDTATYSKPPDPGDLQTFDFLATGPIDAPNPFPPGEQLSEVCWTTFESKQHEEGRLSEAAERLELLTPKELSRLRLLVLELWGLVGRDFDFSIYIKVHGILARCGLELEHDASLREVFGTWT